MNDVSEAHIVEAEERLRVAMLNANLAVIDQMLAPDLILTSHTGQVLGKEEDMAAHRSGLLSISKLEPTEQQIRRRGETAIVSVRVQLAGAYDGKPMSGDFRFTRVWALSPQKTWQVVAAHAGIVA